jgi:hypothetical protein
VKTSDKIDLIATALSKAQAAMGPAKKDTDNGHYKSKYADLASAWLAAQGPITDHGLSVTQTFEPREDKGISISTTLLHTSGQWLQSTLVLYPADPRPQSTGSAITYGRRYGLMAILGLVPDDDDDGNQASGIPPAGAKKTPPAPFPPAAARPQKAPVMEIAPVELFDKNNHDHLQVFYESLERVFPDVPRTLYKSLAEACHGLKADNEVLFVKVESVLKNYKSPR